MEPKPHIVCVPYPAQGHINPMFKLAKLLHCKGFHITFVHTEYNKARLLRARGPDAFDGKPRFRYEAIPDGLPGPVDADVTQDIPALCYSTEHSCLKPFMDLLRRLKEVATLDEGLPPVSCIVSDVAMFFTIDAAEELGIKQVFLWTASACGFLGYEQYDKLVDLGIFPFQLEDNTNDKLDTVFNWAPGANGIRLREVPTFIRTTNPDDAMFNYLRRMMRNCKRRSIAGILFNTFDALEHDVLEFLSSNFPPALAIGPLQFLLDPVESDETKSIGSNSNLWKEDPYCLKWLDLFEPCSVVYINFGSIIVMTNEQLVEFAWGLAHSKKPFLWIIRPDLVIGDAAILSHEFHDATKERGLIIGWCDQERVLAHPTIGGFLTHSGWNSTLESICNGVPMICWPIAGEQPTNCWYCCKKWGIGMEIDTNVKRSEVERQVQELMELGKKGEQMRRKALEWKELAQSASLPTGSSYCNFEKAIKLLL